MPKKSSPKKSSPKEKRCKKVARRATTEKKNHWSALVHAIMCEKNLKFKDALVKGHHKVEKFKKDHPSPATPNKARAWVRANISPKN